MTEERILKPGDMWDEHYRGTKYHCVPGGEFWWTLTDRQNMATVRVTATAGFERIAEEYLSLRPEGGSLRITETGAILTRMPTRSWEAAYVGEYDVPLEFESVDVLGEGVQPLSLWPAFYDGARYSYKNGRLWWKNPVDGVWQETRERLPADIESLFLQVKPTGGSLRVTENGKVLALIAPQPLPSGMKDQYEALTDLQKRLIEVKGRNVGYLPVFLGEYMGGFTLHEAVDLAAPLTPSEEADLMAFLSQYGQGLEDRAPEPFEPFPELADIEDDLDREEIR
ncbi:hypothetical protein [Candidatus Palauibacter sp.]|uniref:hypothetical protein n=1 Tax=Candidatus Palauibacter sp. TaxID=3101350 RepID=UPI003B01131F